MWATAGNQSSKSSAANMMSLAYDVNTHQTVGYATKLDFIFLWLKYWVSEQGKNRKSFFVLSFIRRIFCTAEDDS